MTEFASGFTAGQWQSWDSNLHLLTLRSALHRVPESLRCPPHDAVGGLRT